MAAMKLKAIAILTALGIFTTQIAYADILENVETENGILNISGQSDLLKSSNIGVYILKNGIKTDEIKNFAQASDWLSDIGFAKTDESGNYNFSMKLSANDYTGATLYVAGKGESATAPLGEYNIYVSPNGTDTSEGTMDFPLKTLDGARLRVREIKESSDYNGAEIVVNFLPGEYRTREQVNFTAEDSGTEIGKITYRAYTPGTVTFNHADKLDISKLELVKDESVLKRLPESSRGKVYRMRLNGLYNSDTIFSGYPKLILNDKQQTISRWPNVGYKTMNMSDGSTSIVDNGNSSENAVIRYEDDNIERWRFAKEPIFVIGYFNNQYQSNAYLVDGVDTENKTITLRQGKIKDNKRRWFACNLLEEIDIPSEFFIQRADESDSFNYLYYYPAYDLDENKDNLEFISGHKVNHINFDGVSNVNFNGIKFSKTSGNGIYGNNCSDINIDGCEVEICGTGGVAFENSVNIAVKNCDIHNIHGLGVSLENSDSEAVFNTESCGNVIENNHIYNVNEGGHTSAAGNSASGYGAIFKNNTIHKAPASGINSPSEDGYYAYNELYNLVRDTADASAVYNGRRLTMYGIKYEYNYIHDLGLEGFSEDEHTSGIFWDDFMSGQTAENNIIVNEYKGTLEQGTSFGINMNGGRDNTVRNNVFVGSDYAVRNTDRSNYSYKNDSGLTDIYENLSNAVNRKESKYISKYPQIISTYEEMSSSENGYKFNPRNITVTGNVVADCRMANEENNGVYLNGRLVKDDSKIYNVADTVTVNNYLSPDRSVFINSDEGDYRLSDEGKNKLNVDNSFKLDKSFDLSSIGCKLPFEINGNFKMLYPKNNSVWETADKMTLVWEEDLYADEYEYVVSKNKDLSNPIASGTTVYTMAEIEGLEENTEYYWTVKSKCMSFKNKMTAESEDGICAFTTGSGSVIKNIHYDSAENKININVLNNSDISDGDVYIGQYDSNNELISVKRSEVKLTNGENDIEITNFIPDSKSESCTIFMWARGYMTPLTLKSYRISLE